MSQDPAVILSLNDTPSGAFSAPDLLRLSTAPASQAAEFIRRGLRRHKSHKPERFRDDLLMPYASIASGPVWPKATPIPAIAFLTDDLALLHFSDNSALLGSADCASSIQPIPVIFALPTIVRLTRRPVPVAWRAQQVGSSEPLASVLTPPRSTRQAQSICKHSAESSAQHNLDWFHQVLVSEAQAWIHEYASARIKQPESWPASLCRIQRSPGSSQEEALQKELGNICTYLAGVYSVTGKFGLSVSYLEPSQDGRKTPVEIALLPALSAEVEQQAQDIIAHAETLLQQKAALLNPDRIVSISTPQTDRIHYKKSNSFSIFGMSDPKCSHHERLSLHAKYGSFAGSP